MKARIFSCLVILVLFSMIPLFSYDNTTTNHNFNIKGYYRDNVQNVQTLKLSVFALDSATDRIYHAGDITIDDRTTVSLVSETTVFNWTMTGENIVNGFSLKFTLTPLQAYQSGLYFIPKHTVKMYRKTGNNSYETKTKAFSTKKEGNYPYPGYRSGNTVTKAEFSYTFTNNTGNPYNPYEEGYCTIQVFEYDTESAVNFTYVSQVTVEFTVS